MDNLPNDPPDQNNPANPGGVNPPQTPIPEPPNPPNSPTYPNSPDNNHPEDAVHSEVAQHRPRDAHGHFLPYEHPTNPQTTPNPSLPSEPQALFIHTSTKPSDDDPLFEAKVNNPFSKFFNWIKKLIKSEGINIKIKPLTAIGIALALSVGFGSGYGIGYNSALNQIAKTFFPNSSPIFHRPISLQGTIQKSESGQYYLSTPDNASWLLKLKNNNINLDNVLNKQVTVKGNLTKEPNVIEVDEVISFDTTDTLKPITPISQTSPNTPNTANLPNIPNQDLLPKLYSGLTWEVTQRRVLIFTSGKRRIEQEGVYLESAQVNTIPQDFINYYTQELKSKGFKETLNSTDPDSITITYSKDDLFLTFGIKNVYSGSGENKKLSGYRAYIEHN